MTPITINAANSTVTNNNRYVFPVRGGLQLKNMEVALVKGFIFNSVFNVSQSVFGNNSFQYSYPSGAGTSTFSVTMQDGHYDIDTINDFLHQKMVENKTYLIDNNGENVYYLSLNVSLVYYAVVVKCTPLPTILPAGWTLPVGAPALPVVAVGQSTPQLNVVSAQFGSLIGYEVGSYPPVPQPTIYLVIGTKQAEVNPQYAFNVCLDVVNSPLTNSVAGTIFPFSFTTGFTGQEILDPFVHKFYPCVDGKYSQIVLSILDQQNRPALLNTKFAQFTIEFRERTSK